MAYDNRFNLLRWTAAALLSLVAQLACGQPLAAADTVVVKLVTFYPGGEVFSVFGHTDMRVTQGTSDWYFNYGVYDFEQEGFVYRFVKGDADYLCQALPSHYATLGMEGRRMVEQELNLTQEQAVAVRDYLVANSKPGNNTYRYQYLGDNCSTRPRDIIEMAVGKGLNYPEVKQSVTYRDMMSQYTRNYPWLQFGIDLVLGADLDQPLDVRRQMFIPMALMRMADQTTVTDTLGTRPLVRATQVMVDTPPEAMLLPPTPWFLTPMAAALLLLAVAVLVTVRDWRRHSLTRWFDTLMFGVYALAGCVLFYLMFCSVREATWPNYNALWTNPLMFVGAIAPWLGALRRPMRLYHAANLSVILLTAMAWPWLPQVANVAFFALMAIPALRSLNFLRNN